MDKKIWVLTSEYNEYDQFGEYFVAVFMEKPTKEEIFEMLRCDPAIATDIVAGLGR